MSNTDNVRIGSVGGIWVASRGTTAPTTPSEAYGTGWDELGYVSEDGITESPNRDTKVIKTAQGGVTVRRLITGSELQFKFTMIETNLITLGLYYPGSTWVTASGSTTGTIKLPKADPRAFALDLLDADIHTRLIVPLGEIGDTGDIKYKHDEAIGYEFTMTAYPGSDDTVMLKLSDDPALIT